MDIGRIVKRLLSKWYVVVGVVAVALTCGLIGSKLLVKDVYSSKGACYIASVYEGENNVDMTTGVINNFMNLAKTKAVLGAVAEDVKVKELGYNIEKLDKLLMVQRSDNLINITCEAAAPSHSKAIVNAYINSGMPRARAFLGARVDLFNYTIVATPEEGVRQSRNTLTVIAVSMFVGLIVGVAVVIAPLLLGKVKLVPQEVSQDFETRLLSVVPSSGARARTKSDETQPLSSYDISIATLNNSIATLGERHFCIAPIAKDSEAASIAKDLATTASEYDKVLLVDANLHSQNAEKAFDVGEVGLSEYLLGEASIQDIVYEVSENLSIIPVGKQGEKALAKLLRGGYARAWGEISRLASVIIVTAPRISEGKDALIISSVVKNIALVVGEYTPKKLVNSVISDIDNANINLLGIVMSK